MKQQIVQNQALKLTPQQVMTIRLLELPIDELEQRIHEELESNFALEEGSSHTEISSDSNADDGYETTANDAETTDSSDEYAPDESDDTPADQTSMTSDTDGVLYDFDDDHAPSVSGADNLMPLSAFRGDTTFREDLERQLSLRTITEEEHYLAAYIIESLDESGYLVTPLETLIEELSIHQNHDTSLEAIEEALKIVQDLEPAGIAARNLRECLLLQLRERRATEASQLAYNIVFKAFDDLSNKRHERLLTRFKVDKEQLEAALKVIRSLHPKPADLSGELDTTQVKTSQATPDFIVTNDEGTLILSLNNAHIPPIRINQEYTRMLDTLRSEKATNKIKKAENRQGVTLIRERIGAAHFFIDALHQRRATLTAVMGAIVEFQRDFFMTGDRSMLHPMVLNDIATRSGYDISTISRATSSKYVQTDFGIFALKQLFTDARQTTSGDVVSIAAIQKFLQDCIQNEDKRAPLTDEQLAERLQDAGYTIARRTVAKYREQLGYTTARLRREV